jgi:hypothetical protein
MHTKPPNSDGDVVILVAIFLAALMALHLTFSQPREQALGSKHRPTPVYVK